MLENYYSVKKVSLINDIPKKSISRKKLNRESFLQNKDIIKIFNHTFMQEAVFYHRDVWEAVYPELILY